MSKLLVANWKMNPGTYAAAEKLAHAVGTSLDLGRAEVVLCPPFVWLTDLAHKNWRGVSFGAQDVFWEKEGAFTGEISGGMLKSSRVKYVIVGHSERRKLGDSDADVNRKVKAALKKGLRVILCVGESAVVRKKGFTAALGFVRAQLRADLKGVRYSGQELAVAYEPIWAIGTGRADDPRGAAEMAAEIKRVTGSKTRVLYGGSVTSRNAKNFLQYKEIDGALVGGASLHAAEFKKIVALASKKR